MTVSVAATSHRELDDARARHWEDPAGARDVARRVQRLAHADGELACRALALSGLITLNHGDLQAALALAAEAERHAAEGAAARCEVASLKALAGVLLRLLHRGAAAGRRRRRDRRRRRRPHPAGLRAPDGVPGVRQPRRPRPGRALRRRAGALDPRRRPVAGGALAQRRRLLAPRGGPRRRGGGRARAAAWSSPPRWNATASWSASCTRPAPTSGCSPAAPSRPSRTPSRRWPH